LENAHPQRIKQGSGQRITDVEAGSAAAMHEGLQQSENQGLGRTMPFVKGYKKARTRYG
jgi:hypothetical protein